MSTTAPTSALTMQDAILALQRYWTERGCLVVQPFNTEVGAGTGNPATALRVLGPEPWRVGYVEPSVRPDDARYGENPNRLQTHTQFQVILKPDPGNPQELYLDSLRTIGIDLDAHDVRFVEDNWASPALGAWGLGWEVWLDGMEITQFTYFQQAGGQVLRPVSVEITYGLERILMALQGVQHVMDIRYASGPDGQPISYGEVFGQSEYEMSRYYLDDADIGTNQQLFSAYAAEAQRMLDLELPVPAYTYVLKASHAFNVLDARGAISTTERAVSFKTMRNLTRDAAELWRARREAQGHPLGLVEPLPAAPQPAPEALPTIDAPATALFEIGLEELPWSDVVGVGEAARANLEAKLAATRLPHGAVRVDGTPRRLVLTVAEVGPAEPDATEFKRGPKRAAAFDADGNPTKAAQGFSRGQGVDPSALETVEVDGTAYVGITKAVPGRSAAQVLSAAFAEVVAELRSDKNMRWADPNLSFSRPIRWLLALLGDRPLPVAVSALASGTTTRVLRTAAEPEITVDRADGYLDLLREHGVVADRDARRALVVEQATALAAEAGTPGARVDVEAQAELVEEITDLVEAPRALLGSFEDRYMSLPAAVLTTVMRKHQRYLAVTDGEGRLLPRFVTVANGDCDVDLVRAGNEAVLRARYEDAAFFFGADQQTSPEEFHGRLDTLAFETRLGSMADRARRIDALAQVIADRIGLEGDDRATVSRTGALAKFDLTTQMVVELSSLAGVMAGEYARRAGEPEAVAVALTEMELPRSGGGALPATVPGAVLSLADRLDLLTGMMAIGNVPTGSSDPFGVRRAAIGVVNVLRGTPALSGLSLTDGVAAAAERLAAQGLELPGTLVTDAVALAQRRFELQLLDAGHDHRLVQAALVKADRPAEAEADLAELERRIDEEQVQTLVATVQRVSRILPGAGADEVAPAALSGAEELALARAVSELEQNLGTEPATVAAFVDAAKGLPPVVDAFFDAVLVMDPDPAVRAARLTLLARLATLSGRVLDWSAL
ncbi:glycyl-tRNA synthetase [Friedmanniella endophytica]|uniref:Multifunctional fusion protein n=1 Tax=Microlunatus kandeliicorticis TaxID=1759536 RepID=A0A7W3P6R2_9ACTN|nr:glycine--tRNA ligase [Microlunatus kandeliicorticis]MBA8795238.1 glycyl-tRNA synthetase [Microlunatus kandeliicorticis]